MLREVAGAGGGDPPGSAAAPLLSFLWLRRPPEQVLWRGRRAATAAALPRVACGGRRHKKGEQALRARGQGQTLKREKARGGGNPDQFGTRIRSRVLRGGGLEAAAAAATAKPPRGAGVRAHVCAVEKGREGS